METRFNHVDSQLEGIKVQQLEQYQRIMDTLDRVSQRLEVTSDQIGRLTEGYTEDRLYMKRFDARLDRLAENAERQERTVDRLVGIVEQLTKSSLSHGPRPPDAPSG